LDLYVRAEKFLDQLDTDFVQTLQTSLGEFKTTLKENSKNVGPRDQYIVLVAGKSLLVVSWKRHIKYVASAVRNGFLIEFFFSQLLLLDILSFFDKN